MQNQQQPTAPPAERCRCGHSAGLHVYPSTTLYADCQECACELYDPPNGLAGVPIHPLFAFTENEFRLVSCNQCHKFRVLPEGICERCGWDNDGQGMVEITRPGYCRLSPTKEHEIPFVTPEIQANYCRYCLRTISDGKAKRRERVMRFWKPKSGKEVPKK